MPCDLHSLIADVALLAEGKVLLVRYKDANKYDHQKGWFLPDDALLHLEHPDAGALRILKEQLAFDAASPSLHYIESFKGNDESWHLVFHYKFELPEPPKLSPSADIEKAEWFDLKNLPPPPEVAHH
ncbi:MAG: NUDIX domain-containing protein, partial [Limisphaerales bacterium]